MVPLELPHFGGVGIFELVRLREFVGSGVEVLGLGVEASLE